MSARFEELDWVDSPLGEISLRRRRDPVMNTDVYEVKLGEEYLMSSLFTVAEIEVARLALAALDGDGRDGEGLDVVVGGLGLGYTAQTVLDDPRVRSLVVVDALAPVIDWHERGLVPVSVSSNSDARCRLLLGDFFSMNEGDGFDPDVPSRLFDAVVVDIDHSPRHLLNPSNAVFYELPGMRRLAERIRPGGVFSLWSNDPPDADYLALLAQVFENPTCEVVTFANPLQGHDATNSVYLARRASS